MAELALPKADVDRIVRAAIHGEWLSRHGKLILGASFRAERLKRCQPGGMYWTTECESDPEHQRLVAWQKRRLARTLELERIAWANVLAAEGLTSAPCWCVPTHPTRTAWR